MRYHYPRLNLACILMILTVSFISGCADKLVCRHQVLQMASVGVEKHLETRISIYKVSHPLWDAHAQAQVKVNGEWKWMDDWFGYVVLDDKPSLAPTGYILFYTIPEYLEVLRKGSYATGGN